MLCTCVPGKGLCTVGGLVKGLLNGLGMGLMAMDGPGKGLWWHVVAAVVGHRHLKVC